MSTLQTMKNRQKNALLTLLLITLPSLGYSYDIDKAMKYASNHVYTDYSRTYGYYNGKGGDCANYVSQILEHGGYEQKGEWRPKRKNWINANGIYSNLKNHKNGFDGRLIAQIKIEGDRMRAISGSLDAVKKGDIGFKMYDKPYTDKNGMKHYTSHVFFISSVESSQNIRYMAHSDPRNDKLIRENSDFMYKSSYKKRIVEIWRPQGDDVQNDSITYWRTGNIEFNELQSGFLTGKTSKDITKDSKNKEYLDLFSDKTPKSTAKIYGINLHLEEDTEVKLSLFSKKNTSLRIDGKKYKNIKNPIVYIYHKDKNGKRVIDGKGKVYQNSNMIVSYVSATLKPRPVGTKDNTPYYFIEVTTDKPESNVYYNLYMSDGINGESIESLMGTEDDATPTAQDDFSLYGLKVSSRSVTQGDKLKISVYTKYFGSRSTREIGTIYLTYYVSSSPVFKRSEARLLGRDRTSIGTNDTSDKESLSIHTRNFRVGDNYIHVIVDDNKGQSLVEETNEDNNIQTIKVNVKSPDSSSNATGDDVYPSNLRLSSSRRGSKIKVRVRVNYTGNRSRHKVGTVYTSYYISNSSTFDKNNATYLGYDRSSIGNDDKYDDEHIYVKTNKLSKGTYYIHVVVDDKNGRSSLNESNERNNVQTVRLTTIR